MTGKELILMMAGTAAVAGAGGVGAAALAKNDAGSAAPNEAVIARLDAVAKSIDETNDVLRDNREAVRRLGTRMESVEMGLGSGHATRGEGRRRRHVADGHVVRGASTGVDIDIDSAVDTMMEGDAQTDIAWEGPHGEEMQKTLDEVMQKLGKQLESLDLGEGGKQIRLGPRIGFGGDDSGALAAHLGGLQKAMELRQLPEADRWAKAREDVGLNSVQEDEIRSALDERDEALESALEIERSDDGEGGNLTLKRMDFGKAREANNRYRERVGKTLNDEQKKSWSEGGYDQAFGSGSMGGTTVISVSNVSIDGATDSAE